MSAEWVGIQDAKRSLHAVAPGSAFRQSADHPEALLISALVGTGIWAPDRYGISNADIGAFRQVWEMCSAHVQATGRPPGVEVLARKAPSFPYTKGVDPAWAAQLVRREADNIRLRRAMANAARQLGDDDVDAARAMLANVLDETVPRTKAWDEGMDIAFTDLDGHIARSIPAPWATLDKVTGGIRPGDLWYIGARLNHGKSWVLAYFAAQALLSGKSVHYVSLEMPSHAVVERIVRIILGSQKTAPKLLSAIDSGTPEQSARAVATAKKLIGKARIRVSDPGHVMPATPDFVARCARDSDLVLVDHVGLLYPSSGSRQGSTWEAVRSVSKELKQTALRTSTPILAAAQVNRDGDKGMPKTVHLAESDHLGRDADVVVMMRRTGEAVLQHVADKVRNGPKAKWWTSFEPARGRFVEIGRTEAAALSQFEEE